MKKLVAVGLAVVSVLSVREVFADAVPTPWAWWTMEGAQRSGTVADRTGNGHVLTLGSRVDPTNGVPGSAGIFFNNSYGAYALFDCAESNARSISLWVKDGAVANQYLFADFCGLHAYWTHPGKIELRRATDNETAVAFIPLLRAKEFHHFVLTVEERTGETVGIVAYVDGVKVTEADDVSLPGGIPATETCTLGNSPHLSPAYNNPINDGTLADVRVWNAVLTAAHAAALYEASHPEPTLLGHWDFETIETDEDGNRVVRNDFADAGAGDLTLGPNGYESLVDGVVGEHALYFNPPAGCGIGNNAVQSYAIGKVGSFGRHDFTMAVWVRTEDPTDMKLGSGTRFFGWQGIGAIMLSDRNMEDNVLKYSAPTVVWRHKEWTHLTIVNTFTPVSTNDEKAASVRVRAKIYCNGELLRERESSDDLAARFGNFVENRGFTLGNMSDLIRPIRAQVDDFWMFASSLTEREVKALYHGAAKVSAGDDFAVAGERAKLIGTVFDRAGGKLSGEAIGETEWTVVSAPAGAEPVLKTTKGATTEVTLPVAGEYEFAFASRPGFGKVVSDTVKVTRLAPSGAANAAPAVSDLAADVSGACATLSATVTDADGGPGTLRVRWSKVSGPGAVWFAPPDAAVSSASFGAAGEYVLRLTASDGKDETTETLTVTATGGDVVAQLDDELYAYWPLEATGVKTLYDTVNNLKFDPAKSHPTSYSDIGIGGSYTMRLGDGRAETDYIIGDETTANNDKQPYTWESFSGWFRLDEDNADHIWRAGIYSMDNSHAFFMTLADGTQMNFGYAIQPGGVQPTPYSYDCTENLSNRWFHVVSVLCIDGTADSEIWVNGKKLSASEGFPTRLNAVRMLNKSFIYRFGYCYTTNGIPGANSTAPLYFPGRMDELRFHRRRLTEPEIQYMYRHPVLGRNQAPTADVPAEPIRINNRTSAMLNGAVADDDLPAGRTLTSLWSVASGNPLGLLIDPSNDGISAFTAKKAGKYTLQLKVSDGVRTSYSDACDVQVDALGVMLIVR